MYCDQCGTNMGAGQVCPGCGKNFVPMMPPAHKLDGHIRLLGILWLAISGMRLIPGILMVAAYGFFITFIPPQVPPIVFGLVPFFVGLLWVNLIGGAIAGYALLTRKPWGRIAAIVMAVLNLWDIPFGSALAVYTLWVTLPAEHEQQYREMTETPAAPHAV